MLPTQLGVLLGQAAARQAASATARAHVRLARVRIARRLLAPADGAFDGATALLLRQAAEVKRVFT